MTGTVKSVVINKPPFRPGTHISMTEVNLILNAGGIGDYINWVPAIRYAIDHNPHIRGLILTPRYFEELARHWLGQYSPRFTVRVYDDLDKEGWLERCPSIVPNREQYANATGFHLMELGFVYYNQDSRIPADYAKLPEIRGDEADVGKFKIPPNYAVITTMATVENRKLPAGVINEITDHLKQNGIVPVFLGKHQLNDSYKAKTDDAISTAGVVDLRDKTDLLEAAVILSGAHFVLGLDNGLIHLASCSDVPIISIFTTIDPDLRVAPRCARTIVVTPPESLTCRFCNSNMRYLIGFDFKDCLYKDNLCVNSIKASDITPQIDKLLKETNHGN